MPVVDDKLKRQFQCWLDEMGVTDAEAMQLCRLFLKEKGRAKNPQGEIESCRSLLEDLGYHVLPGRGALSLHARKRNREINLAIQKNMPKGAGPHGS